MVLVLNLFFITFIGRYLTILGLLLFYVLTGIILFMIIQFRMKSLKTRLFGVQDPSAIAKQQKFIEVITGLGVLLFLNCQIKLDFSSNSEKLGNILLYHKSVVL